MTASLSHGEGGLMQMGRAPTTVVDVRDIEFEVRVSESSR